VAEGGLTERFLAAASNAECLIAANSGRSRSFRQ
jgi:hypothetical protein